MTRSMVSRTVLAFALASLLARAVVAADAGLGTFVMQPTPDSSGAKGTGGLALTVEPWGKNGRKLTYRIKVPMGEMVSTVESPMDGSDALVLLNGKPTGETMGIKRLDDRHTVAVLKLNGKRFGTSKSTLSPDSKVLTVENEITDSVGGRQAGKHTEVWLRK
jgi:hypothetical protein